MLLGLLTTIAPVFVCAIIGYGWTRAGRPFDTDTITGLVLTFGVPCLVASTLAKVSIAPGVLGLLGMASVVLIAAFGLIGWVVLRLLGWSLRAYLPAVMFPNVGNMGLPLSLFAFGEEGLALGVALFAVVAVGNFSIGTAIATGTLSFRRLARVPVLYGIAVGLFFMLTGIEPPEWLANTAHTLGGMVVPIMLITLGVSLGRLKVRGFGRAVVLSVLRLAMGFGLGVLVSEAFGLQGAARGVLILQSSMPTAVFNYLIALRWGSHADEVAGMVVISTLMSFALLPALMWYVM